MLQKLGSSMKPMRLQIKCLRNMQVFSWFVHFLSCDFSWHSDPQLLAFQPWLISSTLPSLSPPSSQAILKLFAKPQASEPQVFQLPKPLASTSLWPSCLHLHRQNCSWAPTITRTFFFSTGWRRNRLLSGPSTTSHAGEELQVGGNDLLRTGNRSRGAGWKRASERKKVRQTQEEEWALVSWAIRPGEKL